ncbi:MAG: hypothetical protein H7Y20_01665, partial [Bryobacteraceae bacterium]|nr:hypothetical protein [Bryobacteraceae bacterium]
MSTDLRVLPTFLIALAASAAPPVQKFYTYVGEAGADHVTIAWGTTSGDNTIGRSSKSAGPAIVRVGTRETAVSDTNWTVIRGLEPDTEYDYEVRLSGQKIGGS